MAEVQGLRKLVEKLRAKAAQSIKDDNVSVLVGYTASYALWVHEMDAKTLGQGVPRPSGLGHYWGPSDEGPKFLERPARELAKELGRIVANMLRQRRTMAQGLVAAGLRLQRESQKMILVTRPSYAGRQRPLGIVTMKDLVEELLGELAEW